MQGMAMVAIFWAATLAVLFILRSKCGMRAYGWGALILGCVCAIYLAAGDPGLLALVILPTSAVLILLGGGTLLITQRRPPA